MTPAIWLRFWHHQVTMHAVQLAGERTLFRAQMKADCGALGALALHLWDRTEMHTQWWGKALVTEWGLWCPAFTLSCFHANCPTNRRAQASPLHTPGLEVRQRFMVPVSLMAPVFDSSPLTTAERSKTATTNVLHSHWGSTETWNAVNTTDTC